MSMVATLPEELIPAGNVYPKYTTRNPIARALVEGFLTSLYELTEASGAKDLHEVGCGEGFLATMLARRGHQVRASDLSPATIAEARRRAAQRGATVDFHAANLYDLTPDPDGAALIVCCEVLEHVPDPERALRVLGRLAQPHLVVSVPREPLWRVLNLARGKYWRDLGNTPGHLQHWSTDGFLKLLRAHVDVVEIRTPLPWTMALCRRR